MALTRTDLEPHLERADLTLDELIQTATELLEAVAPEQTRYKVRERPDVRTVRYYTSRKLLPKPLSYDGGRARYGALHLLRLLRIKQLQAQHQTLTAIRDQLEGATEGDLIAAVLGSVDRPAEAVPVPAPKRIEAHAKLAHIFKLSGAELVVEQAVFAQSSHRRALALELRELATLIESQSPPEEAAP